MTTPGSRPCASPSDDGCQGADGRLRGPPTSNRSCGSATWYRESGPSGFKRCGSLPDGMGRLLLRLRSCSLSAKSEEWCLLTEPSGRAISRLGILEGRSRPSVRPWLAVPVVVLFAVGLLMAGFQSRIPSSGWLPSSPELRNADETPLRLPLPEDRHVVAVVQASASLRVVRPPEASLSRTARTGIRFAKERHGAGHGLRAPPSISR